MMWQALTELCKHSFKRRTCFPSYLEAYSHLSPTLARVLNQIAEKGRRKLQIRHEDMQCREECIADSMRS